MDNLNLIAEKIRLSFDTRTQAREQALRQARELTRLAAHAIRAVHRSEYASAQENMGQASKLVTALKEELAAFPDLYTAGYTQDSIKEYAEACLTYALITNQPLPDMDELGVETAAYVNGLAEASFELRRRCLDILRQGYSDEAERLLFCMDEIYALLVTLDYPDAITNGLRRQTDVARGILERTRGEMTVALREHHLHNVIEELLQRLAAGEKK